MRKKCNTCGFVPPFDITSYICRCGNPVGLKNKKRNLDPAKPLCGSCNKNKTAPKPTKPLIPEREITIEDGIKIDHFTSIAAPFVKTEDLTKDSLLLLQKVQGLDIKRIVGIPRSGLIPASILATHIGVPLYSMSKDEGLVLLNNGSTRFSSPKKERDTGITLIVEDSCATGRSIFKFRKLFADDNIKFASVYTTKKCAPQLDYYAKILPLPHWFEWNLFGNDLLIATYNISTDMDGILCHDCPVEDDDDGDRYIKWMNSVKPLYCPASKINNIVTARLEKYRKPTEEWLKKHNVSYKKLIMGPWKNNVERSKACIGTWKAEKINEEKVYLFFESDWHQTQIISSKYGGGVICPSKKVCIQNNDGPDWEDGLAAQWYT